MVGFSGWSPVCCLEVFFALPVDEPSDAGPVDGSSAHRAGFLLTNRLCRWRGTRCRRFLVREARSRSACAVRSPPSLEKPLPLSIRDRPLAIDEDRAERMVLRSSVISPRPRRPHAGASRRPCRSPRKGRQAPLCRQLALDALDKPVHRGNLTVFQLLTCRGFLQHRPDL